ncbi:MAG: NAD+ synthase [Bacteroidales bacterium]
MKIALAQLNYHIGNFPYNKKEIINTILRAEKDYADLVVFSELSVCGYPPLDLLDYREFVNQCNKTVNEIAEYCVGIAAIIGGPRINPNPSGKMLFNSAFFLHDGKVRHIQDKTLLPTYDIFDEYRYFEPNDQFKVIVFKGKKIALTVCEDLWDDQPAQGVFSRNRLYNASPMEKLYEYNPDMLINIAASPFSYTKIWGKKNIFIQNAKRYNLPVFYVNQVGAQTELIFEGASLAIHPNGIIHKELNWFEPDYQVVDLDEVSHINNNSETHDTYGVIAKIHDALILGLRDFFSKLNFEKAVLGLSGGIDSAVSLVIAQRALGGENLRVLLMPSIYSSESSVSDSKQLADNLGVHYDEIPIQEVLNSFSSALEPIFRDMPEDVTEENLQARIRGSLLMAISNKFGHILLNTSNKSESAVGYATLYGDMTGALSVLGDVYKTDIYKLAQYINRDETIIPENIIHKAPSAELRPDQKDSDTLPEYEFLDKILFQYIELQKSTPEIIEEGFDEKTVKKVIHMVNANEYKRYQAPPVLRISSKAFGAGRRMPLVAKY